MNLSLIVSDLTTSHAESFDATHKTHVVIKPDGSVTFIGPGNFKTICKVNLNMYPLDEQECSLKLGSWVLSGAKVRFMKM